jgi:hypothetical protein
MQSCSPLSQSAPAIRCRREGEAPSPAPCCASARSRPHRSVAAASSAASPPTADDAAALEALLAATGASTSLRLGSGSVGRGLFVSADCAAGATLLRVPLQHALVVTTGGSKPLVESLLRQKRSSGLPISLEALLSNAKLPASPRLAAALLWATGRGGTAPCDAAWAAALRLLPADGFTVPNASAEAVAEAVSLAHAHAPATELAQRSEACWAWALSCVASRTFGADAWSRTGDREGVLGTFVPLADLLNHAFNPSCDFRLRAEGQCFEVVSRRPLRCGEEARISYGEGLANDELASRYGFRMEGNPNGEVKKVPGKRIHW